MSKNLEFEDGFTWSISKIQDQDRHIVFKRSIHTFWCFLPNLRSLFYVCVGCSHYQLWQTHLAVFTGNWWEHRPDERTQQVLEWPVVFRSNFSLVLWPGSKVLLFLTLICRVWYSARSHWHGMLASRCRQTLLCLDTSSQTWKWTGGYTVNTRTHTQKQGIGRGRLADGKTAESREDVEMKVTVSWGPSSWGKITLNDWIYCIRLHKLAWHVVGRPSVNMESTIVSTSLLHKSWIWDKSGINGASKQKPSNQQPRDNNKSESPSYFWSSPLFCEHIKEISNIAYFHLCNMAKMRSFLRLSDTGILIHVSVR